MAGRPYVVGGRLAGGHPDGSEGKHHGQCGPPGPRRGRHRREIVSAIRRDLVEAAPLVDELIVIDSRSTDDTADQAVRAGAKVIAQDEILPELDGPDYDGKGEALWKSLAVTSGDLVVFVDADLREFSTSFVTGLLGPLLADPRSRT